MPTQKIDRHTNGVFVIAATPFAADAALDLDSTDRMVDFYLGCGVGGMTILGIMGEASKLTEAEARSFVDRVLTRVAGRIPVVVGVSSPGLDNLARLADAAMSAGAAGIMVAPPPGPPVEDRVMAYLGEVCRAVGPDVPICYQDYPQTTGVPVSAATILALTRDHPQIVMLKHEDCPGLAKIGAVRAGSGIEAVPRMSILCGNGGLYLPQELDRGADGAMTGFAFPEMLVEVVARHARGETDAAEDLYDAYLPLLRHEQQPGVGLALRKEILHRRGAIACPRTRAPGPQLSPADRRDLDRLLARTETKVKELTDGS